MSDTALPPLLMDDDLRAIIESVLREGETLTAFLEEVVRRAVEHRIIEREFNERGERAWEEYQRTGISYSIEEVTNRLGAIIQKQRKRIEAQNGKPLGNLDIY